MLGLAGAFILTAATAPQVVRLVRSRSAVDFSWGYILLSLGGCVLLTAHAVHLGDVAFAVVNGSGLLFWCLVAFMRAMGTHRRTTEMPTPPSHPA